MAGENYVQEKVCEQICKNNEKRLEQGERRMNSHGEDITDLKIIMAQLTQLQTTNTAALAAMEARVQELESSRREHDDVVRSPPESLINGSTAQLVIKGTFLLAVIIILAAIGQNVSPEFVAKLFGK